MILFVKICLHTLKKFYPTERSCGKIDQIDIKPLRNTYGMVETKDHIRIIKRTWKSCRKFDVNDGSLTGDTLGKIITILFIRIYSYTMEFINQIYDKETTH